MRISDWSSDVCSSDLMTQQQGIELARDFVSQEFVERGMIADLNVHWDIGADGLAKPHAHVMLTMREVGEDGCGAKVRDWNRTELIEQWRVRCEGTVNRRLCDLALVDALEHHHPDTHDSNGKTSS